MTDGETVTFTARCPQGCGDALWKATRREIGASWTDYSTAAAPPRYQIDCDVCEAAA